MNQEYLLCPTSVSLKFRNRFESQRALTLPLPRWVLAVIFRRFPSIWWRPLTDTDPGVLLLLPHWGVGSHKLPYAGPVQLWKGAFVFLLLCWIVHVRFWTLVLCISKFVIPPGSVKFIYTFWLSFYSATKTFIELLFWVNYHKIHKWSWHNSYLYRLGRQIWKQVTSILNMMWK